MVSARTGIKIGKNLRDYKQDGSVAVGGIGNQERRGPSAVSEKQTNRQPPSGQSLVYQVTQLRTEGVHYRESAGIGPVVLKVVRVTGAAS